MIKKNSTKNICIEFKMIKEIILAIVVLKKKQESLLISTSFLVNLKIL